MPMDNTLAVKPYVEALKRSLSWLLLFGLAGGALVFAVASSFGPTYESHFSYLISLSQRDEASQYRFDGYYALQATDLFAATLARWIQTPEVIVAAHKAAGLQLTTQDPRELSRSVHAEKTAPQLVEVTVRGKNSNDATLLVKGLQAVMKDNIDRYHDQGIPAVQFRVVTTDTWQGQTKLAGGVIAVATFVLIVFLGANGVLLAETFREQVQATQKPSLPSKGW